MFFFMPLTPAQRKAEKERHAKVVEERVKLAVPWSDDIKFQPKLTIKAETFKPLYLFPELKPTPYPGFPERIPENRRKLSSDGVWMVVNQILPRGTIIPLPRGNTQGVRGDVMFDGDVAIPTLHWKPWGSESRFDDNPMMSLTPMELMSLRTGTRLATGDVVIVGLGLGHQLIEVSKRKQVKSITLIERNKSLLKLVWPRVKKYVARDLKVKIVVGDVFKTLPQIKADIALVDIDSGFGFNHYTRDKLVELCAAAGGSVKRIWVWGGGRDMYVKKQQPSTKFPVELRL